MKFEANCWSVRVTDANGTSTRVTFSGSDAEKHAKYYHRFAQGTFGIHPETGYWQDLPVEEKIRLLNASKDGSWAAKTVLQEAMQELSEWVAKQLFSIGCKCEGLGECDYCLAARDWMINDTPWRIELLTSLCHPKSTGELRLHGKSTNHIWLMEDGTESHPIGVRLDCGDSGTVYFSREQAADLAKQLVDDMGWIEIVGAEKHEGEWFAVIHVAD